MTRVFYAYCTKPDLPRRIAALRQELGWDPVAVVTSSINMPELTRTYPDIPVHDRVEFSHVVCPMRRGPLSARNLIADANYIQPWASGILSTMERTALPDSFTLRERKRYLRKLVHEIGSLLDELKPDVVHFDETPHGTVYIVIYHLCKRRGIPTIWFVPTGFTGYSLLEDTICDPPLLDHQAEGAIPDLFLQRIEHLRKNEQFSHWYMDRQRESMQSTTQPTRTLKVWKLFLVNRWPLYARNLMRSVILTVESNISRRSWLDEPLEFADQYQFTPVNDRLSTNRDYERALDIRWQYKLDLAAAYARLTSTDAPLDRPYVFFPLHFQPERTTNPEGGILADQFVAVASIHEALPDGWFLYVKGHPTQLNPDPAFASEKGRSVADYEDLTELENVRLIPMDVPSSTLIRNSLATVVITGTAGWEAAVNGVPGIHMSHTWYEGFPGTLYISTFDELYDFFQNVGSYEPTGANAEETYLRNFAASAFQFEINEQDLPEGMFTSEQQVSGAVSAMRWWQDNRMRS